ncbi:MAG: hypothetical protein JJE18_04585 [Eubacteriaceae bacterium]|nr:hypothetical protein [Eubacteriaceae bacterium]
MAFDFKRLIKKYSVTPAYVQTETPGSYDADTGEWVPGTLAAVEIDGAIVPLSGQDLTYGEAGTYTIDDRKLYCYDDFKTGLAIKHKDINYTIAQKLDYSDFSGGVFIYIIKKVGV